MGITHFEIKLKINKRVTKTMFLSLNSNNDKPLKKKNNLEK
jgi:hypothetical protein